MHEVLPLSDAAAADLVGDRFPALAPRRPGPMSGWLGWDFEAAYQHATTITRPGELADHVPHALWLTLDLTEAAVRTGRHAEAAAHVAAVRQAGVALRARLGCCR